MELFSSCSFSDDANYKLDEGGKIMATKSILKTVVIKKEKDASRFINALENAAGKKEKEVVIKQNVMNVRKNEIKKVLGIE